MLSSAIERGALCYLCGKKLVKTFCNIWSSAIERHKYMDFTVAMCNMSPRHFYIFFGYPCFSSPGSFPILYFIS
jgi:hypothetical protein